MAMITAPASIDDWIMFRYNRRASVPADLQIIGEMAARPAYLEGDPDSIAALYGTQYMSP
jgi:hypothetical protein